MASINLSSFAGAGAQFFDNNGVPLTGGLLYVYTAGTTTPATTYTTSSGTVANTNPIVLDSAGRTPNEVWVNGGVLYKFILKTSTGVTIGTYDNIPSIDDPTAFNNLVTVTGTNTLIGTSTPPYTAYVTGMTLSFVVVNTNTGAVTIDVDGLGAREITFAGSTPLIAGQMTAGAVVIIEYDGTRFQLMTTSGALAITASSLNGGQLAGFRNHIINGACQVAQRGSTAVVAGTWTYGGADRIAFNPSGFGAASGTIQQYTAQSTQSSYAQGVVLTTTGSGVVAFQSRIEAVNCKDLNGKSVTFTAYVYHDIGTPLNARLSVYKANSADTFSSQTLLGQSSVTSIVTSTFTKLTYTIALGATDASNGIAVSVEWPTVGAITSRSFLVADMQLEIGVISTPLEFLSYGAELALCQRYYESTGGFLQSPAIGNIATTIGYAATKRVAPTVTFPSVTYSAASTLVYQSSFGNALTGMPVNIAASAGGGYASFTATASAEL